MPVAVPDGTVPRRLLAGLALGVVAFAGLASPPLSAVEASAALVCAAVGMATAMSGLRTVARTWHPYVSGPASWFRLGAVCAAAAAALFLARAISGSATCGAVAEVATAVSILLSGVGGCVAMPFARPPSIGDRLLRGAALLLVVPLAAAWWLTGGALVAALGALWGLLVGTSAILGLHRRGRTSAAATARDRIARLVAWTAFGVIAHVVLLAIDPDSELLLVPAWYVAAAAVAALVAVRVWRIGQRAASVAVALAAGAHAAAAAAPDGVLAVVAATSIAATATVLWGALATSARGRQHSDHLPLALAAGLLLVATTVGAGTDLDRVWLVAALQATYLVALALRVHRTADDETGAALPSAVVRTAAVAGAAAL